MEVPRGMEPTGTNGRTRHTLSDPCGSGLVLWWFSRWMARNAVSCGHDDDTGKAFIARVRCPVPGPPRPESVVWLVPLPADPFVVGRFVMWFCGGHGPGETPGPFPNPEAKAWHGDGTALERVWESSTPPHSYRWGFPSSFGSGNPLFLFVVPASRPEPIAPGVPVGPFPLLGVRIIPRAGRSRTPRDFRNFRGASCAYPMVE